MTGPRGFATRFGPAVMLFAFETFRDDRGELHPIDFPSLPFEPRRMFFVRPSSAGQTRGGHAQKTAHQLLVCASGQIDIVVSDGGQQETFRLDRAGKAIYLQPSIWSEQTYLTADALLLVLSSECYDPEGYSHNLPDPKT
jgi:UDP-2-acetamido-3-amino-2,3-dideoxy-glucuronate N-acetyltransferase